MIIDFLKTLSIIECSTIFVRSSPPCIFVTVFTACPRCWQCKKVLWDGFVICSYPIVLCFPSKYVRDHVKWKWFVKIWLGYFMVSFNQKTWLIMFCHGLPLPQQKKHSWPWYVMFGESLGTWLTMSYHGLYYENRTRLTMLYHVSLKPETWLTMFFHGFSFE